MTYEHKRNGGAGDNDCLIVSLGRAVNPRLSEQAAKQAGWQAMLKNIQESSDLERLRVLYVSAHHAYKEDFSRMGKLLPLTDDGSAPENLTELKKNLGAFIRQLSQRSDITKSVELFGAFSDDFFLAHNIILVDRERLINGQAALFAEMKSMIDSGRTPQIIAHNGSYSCGHFSNVISVGPVTQFDYDDFTQLVAGPLGGAVGYKASHSTSSGVKKSARTERVLDDCTDTELQTFAKNVKNYGDIELFQSTYQRLSESRQASLSDAKKMTSKIQEVWDAELARQLQFEEFNGLPKQQGLGPRCSDTARLAVVEKSLLFFKHQIDVHQGDVGKERALGGESLAVPVC
ncbi:hypothetical protein [Piscirickettsia litoralis]|uniref:Uncharacterized protein n=1 Tax=Piscirickettsia litoralis TaxID=1891921 RepID=A0ABX3A7D3_9GAMM|nr:hypothetical protein [Piscirickettsia litoralis]ODN43611.1 hypothetical protein BGC07_12700 [Piscirickettsia litoralis]